ncbi:unnamed protein product [Prunus armeniaca]|uniref:Uncharacterized protein n=1 Tax=Prunus armeniaca TaxID=36596 RepID=A0A6J5V1P2_PRUAR|nr:unnamed protein product [Prunus armeniaca]
MFDTLYPNTHTLREFTNYFMYRTPLKEIPITPISGSTLGSNTRMQPCSAQWKSMRLSGSRSNHRTSGSSSTAA